MEGSEGEGEDDDYFSFSEHGSRGEPDDDFCPSACSTSPFPSARDSSLTSSTGSSSFSSSFFSRVESLGFWNYPPVSEYEEIPSPQWLSPSLWPPTSGNRPIASTKTTTRLRVPAAVGTLTASYREQLLPPDLEEILARAVVPVDYSSWEDLCVRLCSSILIDEGKKCFALDKSTGKKCYLLSARELRVTWEDQGFCCKWTSVPHSRFSRVARLLTVWWSGIHAEMEARALSPGTTYIACLVFGYSGRDFGQGLNSEAQEATVSVGVRASKNAVFLQPNAQQRRRAGARVPRRRGDGWLELEMGEFTVGADEEGEVVRMSLEQQEVRLEDESILGLVVEGIEVRPKPFPAGRKAAASARLRQYRREREK